MTDERPGHILEIMSGVSVTVCGELAEAAQLVDLVLGRTLFDPSTRAR